MFFKHVICLLGLHEVESETVKRKIKFGWGFYIEIVLAVWSRLNEITLDRMRLEHNVKIKVFRTLFEQAVLRLNEVLQNIIKIWCLAIAKWQTNMSMCQEILTVL